CATGASENDDAYRTIRIGLVKAAVELGLELVRERVHALRPIERDGRDGIVDLIQQLLAHPCSFVGTPCRDAVTATLSGSSPRIRAFVPWNPMLAPGRRHSYVRSKSPIL